MSELRRFGVRDPKTGAVAHVDEAGVWRTGGDGGVSLAHRCALACGAAVRQRRGVVDYVPGGGALRWAMLAAQEIPGLVVVAPEPDLDHVPGRIY